jgi:hypothetical protein
VLPCFIQNKPGSQITYLMVAKEGNADHYFANWVDYSITLVGLGFAFVFGLCGPTRHTSKVSITATTIVVTVVRDFHRTL